MSKILILDIETAPNLAYVWKIWKENVGLNQLREIGGILSFAAKWLGEDLTWYADVRMKGGERAVLDLLLLLLNRADIVVAHNAKKFDIPTINARAIQYGMLPPSPYKVVDTYQVVKKEFRFISNKLEYVAKALKCKEKLAHKEFPGFELWSECLAGNKKAWEELQKYNVQDVVTLEEVYLKLRPWIKNHPNVGVHLEKDNACCPKCGSDHVHFRGYATTSVGKYRRFVCLDCGGWARTRYNEYPKEPRKNLLANIAD